MSRSVDRPSLDRNGVDRLVIEHLPAALRLARRLTGDGDTAEDVVQEALRRVLASWRSYRGEAPFKAWLLSIVVNVDRDRRRRLVRRRQTEDPSAPVEELTARTPSSAEQLESSELSDQIRRAIDRLSDRQREVALLTFGESMTAAEVAQALDMTPANVYTCLHLARKKIAAAVGLEDAGRDRHEP